MQPAEPTIHPEQSQQPTARPRDAAQRIVLRSQEILALWEERLRRDVPATRRQARPALIDSLASYLVQLARMLASDGANRDELEETCRHHASERALHPGFSLEQLLTEYSVLHRVILDVLEQEARLTDKEARLLSDAIEHGITDAASAYVGIQRSRETAIAQEAQRAKEQVDALLQHAREGVATVDMDRRYLYLNDEAAQILSAGGTGKTKEQLLGRTMSQEFPELLGDKFFWAQIKAQECQRPVRFEQHVERLGRWLEISVHPSRSFLHIYFHDITLRRKAEQELARGEARFRSAVESVTDYAIYVLDHEGNIASWNAGAERMKQYKADEIIGKHFSLLYQPEDAAAGRPEHNLKETRIRGRHEDEWWRRKKDGSRFWADVVITALYDDSGHLSGFTKVIRDLTDRKRREENERFFVDLASTLSVAISYEDSLRAVAQLVVQAHADWCLVVANRDMTPRRIEALVHRDPAMQELIERFHERHPGRFEVSDGPTRVLHTGRAETGPTIGESAADEIAMNAETAELFEALGVGTFMCVPLSARGRMLGSITFARSAADPGYSAEDLKFAEEVGRRAALTLDAVYSQRMIGLREEVLATVSHDLRTPLSTIVSSAELIARRAHPGEDGEFFRKQAMLVYRSAQTMNRLISDLLDLAKIEGGRFTLERQTMDVCVLLHEVAEAHQQLALQKSIVLETSMAMDRCELEGDRDRLLQVFSNLIGNALKFTPEGGRVLLRLESCGEDVLFLVRDTGPGIAETDLMHIFERYWQASATARNGTGLGLSITKGIIEAHGGEVWVESQPGVGSSFFFRLPASTKPTER